MDENNKLRIGNLIYKKRVEKGISQKQLGEYTGVKIGTVCNWEKGRNTPDIETTAKICEVLDIDPYEILGAYDLKNKETEIIENYRSLDEHGKRVIDNILKLELERIKQENLSKQKSKDYDVESTREIMLYELPASAGRGQFLDSDNYRIVELSNVPKAANFAVPVVGDSMEPMFYDGDIVFVRRQQKVEDGEIGVFMLNGEGFIKKLHYENGKCYLVSLNEKYPPIEIHEWDDLKVSGKVIK